MIVSAGLSLGVLSAQAEADAERRVKLRSCYLADAVAGAHCIELRATIVGGGGHGTLTFDPNRYQLNEFGDRTVGTKIGLRRVAVLLRQAQDQDPQGRGRSLIRVVADGAAALPAPISLVASKATGSYRLVLGSGDDLRVLAMEPVPPAPAPAPAPATREVAAAGLTLRVPRGWRQEQPSSSMRVMQFGITGVGGGAAELAVFRFPGGGSVDANVRRWVGQFRPEGRTSKVTTGSVDGREYVVVDVSGTYNRPIGPPMRRQSEPVAGQRMVAVILQPSDGGSLYFLKAVGDAASIAGAASAIRASFGGDARTERARK